MKCNIVNELVTRVEYTAYLTYTQYTSNHALSGNSSPTPSVYSDLPEMLYVSEFGKRTGSPMGPREMPDHWIKI